MGTIMNMTNFKTKSLKNREKKARMEASELHPCILPEDKQERSKFMEEFCILDDSGDFYEDDRLKAFTDLVVAQTP